MRLLGFEIGRAQPQEARAVGSLSPENPRNSIDVWLSQFRQWASVAGPAVTVESALGVPAIWCAVNVLANLIARVPLHEFERGENGARNRVSTGMIAGMLAGTVNDDLLTSYKWRRQAMVSVLTTGAGRTWIETNKAGQPVNLWPLETDRTTVVRKEGRTLYRYRQTSSRTVTYEAREVIDITFLGGLDGVSHFNPIERLRDTIGLAIALEQYAAKFFANGGVPPLALQAPAGSPAAIARGKNDTRDAIRNANAAGDPVLYMPDGTRLEPIGFDPEKGQLVDAQRFVVEQMCRLYDLPPSFVHDLTHGNFANTEQADLHITKHSGAPWFVQWETELNAKLYGPRQGRRYVEFNLDGVQRGDFKSRTEGWARAIQTGQATPNEARRAENRPDMPGGDRLLVQGATVPLEDAGKIKPPPAAPKPEGETEHDA